MKLRGRMSSVRVHQIVLVTAVLVPGALFTAAAWQNRNDVINAGDDAIERTTTVMQEHAHKVFETAELAIGLIQDHIEDENWPTVATPATSEFLRRVKAPMEQLVSIWIADGAGTIQAGSQAWPPGAGIGERNFFKVQSAAAARGDPIATEISPTFTGVATAVPSFAVVRRRSEPSGVFNGTVHVAVSPAYFTRFYAEAAPPLPHFAALLLESGAVLAQEPAAGGMTAFPGSSPIMQDIRQHRLGAVQSGLSMGGTVMDYSVRRVAATGAYVAFAVPHAALLAVWERNLKMYGLVAAGAALTLLAVGWLALRGALAEQAALVRLREATRRRLAAEQQLRHAQRMEAVGQLTGGIAHDFNNLLTAILGNLELIQRTVRGVGGPADAAVARVERLTSTAIKAVARGASLTKSLLAFSRKQPLQPRPIDANALLTDFLELIRQGAGTGVTVSFAPAPTLPHCVADPAELEAAVLNLVINARDAMDGRGALSIRSSDVELDAAALAGNVEARPGRFVAITLTDSGHGMAPEVAERAFEPFFTTKPVGKGTGLGLSQVFGFVRQLGGHVGLETAPGAGCAITLYLPVAP